MKYIKTFENHTEYETFTGTTEFIKPNVSLCKQENEVYYNPLRCEESTVYELVGEPSYPSEITGNDTSFDISFNYKRTDTNIICQETVTEGSDTITVECGSNPSTSDSRIVSGTVVWNGVDIEYSVIQGKYSETRVVAKFNVTDTSSPTRIGYNQYTSGFSAIEIDGIEQVEVISAYTFDTLGEHTVKYTLKDPTSIVNMAFYQCSGLTSIDIPDSVTSIGNYAFGYCSSLTSINIPDSVTSIGFGVFQNCTGLTSATIGNGVTSISENTFDSCRSLTSINIPSGVTGIGECAFQSCSGLTSIDIPDSVTSIGNSAFTRCTGLTNLTIGNGVTSIRKYAFQYCSGLTSIVIPDSVTTIGNQAFGYCSKLTSITSNATTAPTIQYNTFYSVKTGGTLYVPQGSTGYDVWMGTGNYYLGLYNWTKVEQ